MPDYTRLTSTASPSSAALVVSRQYAGPGRAADTSVSDPAPLRAAIYARSAIGDPEALRRQEACCRAHAAARGWAVVSVWAEGGSGLAPTLPGLAALLAAVDSGSVDVVVTTSPDRISRDVDRMWDLADQLRNAGVALACVDGDGPGGALRAAIARWHAMEATR